MKGKLSGAAVIVMSSIIISRITGFFREMLVPNVIGFNEIGDAYNIAFRLTGLMYDLLVGGAIAAALIPVLTGYITKNDEEEGWKAVGTFINVIFIAMLVVCTLGIIFAPYIVPMFAAGFKSENQKQLTIDLVRILFPSVAFLMLAGLLNGILNSYKRFAAAAYGPVIYNLGSIASIFFLWRTQMGIRAVAYGIMASSTIYFLFQLAFSINNLKFYKFKIFLKNVGFIKLLRLAVPSLISSSIVQINVIISSTVASFFAVGSVTALNMADRIWQMPYGVFAQGMGIAILPTLSANFAERKIKEYKDTLMKGLKTVLVLTIPSAIGFIVLNQPIIRTVFQFTKKFDEIAVITAGGILMFFSIALLSQSTVTILNRAFYAINDTKTPLYTGTATIIVNLLFGFIFYKFTNLHTAGTALSYSIASFVNAFLLFLLLTKKIPEIDIKDFSLFLIRVGFCSILMGIILFFTNKIVWDQSASKLVQLVILVFEIGVGVVVYMFSAILFKVEEAKVVTDMLKKKFGRR